MGCLTIHTIYIFIVICTYTDHSKYFNTVHYSMHEHIIYLTFSAGSESPVTHRDTRRPCRFHRKRPQWTRRRYKTRISENMRCCTVWVAIRSQCNFPKQNWLACVSYITAVYYDKILQLLPREYTAWPRYTLIHTYSYIYIHIYIYSWTSNRKVNAKSGTCVVVTDDYVWL